MLITKMIEDYFSELKQALDSVDRGNLKDSIEILTHTYYRGNAVYVIGNGGSAATASHFACDLGKGTLLNPQDPDEKRFRVFSLTDNVATLTAIANDIGYEDVFYQQLLNILKPEDVLVSISASGNSPNILKAMRLAKERTAHNIAFLGFDGGKAKELADYKIIVPSRNYGIIEDVHLTLEHVACQELKERLKSTQQYQK